MSKSTVSQETLERLLGNLSEASHRISKDVEKQAKQIDHKIKAFVASSEKAGDRLIKMIDTDVRAQLDSLRHEVEHLSRRLSEMVSVQEPAKQATKADSSRKATKAEPAVATKKTAARKPATHKAPAVRKPAARKAPARTGPGAGI